MNAPAAPRQPPPKNQPSPAEQSNSDRSLGKASNSAPSQNTAALLARFVHYTSALMEANQKTAPQLLVRQLSGIVPCQRASLIQLRPKVKILSVSSGNEQLRQSAYAQQLKKYAKQQRNEHDTLLSETNNNQCLWLPLSNDNKSPNHALWLERPKTTWSAADQAMLSRARPFFVRALQRQKAHTPWFRRSAWVAAAAIVAAIGFWPVTQSAVATAEVIASDQEYVYAPLSGVVKKVHIQPGEAVVSGQLLLSYDARLLEQQALESREAISVAVAELTRLQAAGFRDVQARAAIPVQQLKLTQSKQAADYYNSQLELAEMRASTSGQIVLDDAERLEGAAVQMGELLLSIADPKKSELKLSLPVKDRGLVSEGAKVTLRLDSQPFTTFDASISRVSYDVTTANNERAIIEAHASWVPNNSANENAGTDISRRSPAQLGERGSARIEAGKTSLGMQLLRKPLLATMDIFGL